MKKNLLKIITQLSCLLILSGNLFAQTGTWTSLADTAPHENMGVMLLLTDGTVICHNISGGIYGTGWDKLTPDIYGSYVNGTWDTIAPMENDRLFFSSQVLPNGNVYVAGGEYGLGGENGEIYNPLTNTWTIAGDLPTGCNISDGNSEILYNGTILEGPQLGSNPSYDCLIYNPTTNLYSAAPSSIYNHDESAWLKLPDSSILFVGIGSTNSNRYIPQTNTWVNDGTLPVNIYDTYGSESGPAIMLPNGKAIFFGAAGPNAIYTPSGNISPGTWTVAASFPIIGGVQTGQTDAPAAMMVNGKILCAVSPIGTSFSDEFLAPVYFVEYDYTNDSFTQVTGIIPTITTDSLGGVSCFQVTMLNLPDGNILVAINQDSITSSQYFIYTPGSAAIPQGKPTINTIIPAGCGNYKITGKLFNGISEGSAYGDDWEMSTNYPIVRLTDGTNVYYARTTNWNRIGAVQTDSLEDTAQFTLPSIPLGTYSLVVVANGFASNPTLFTVSTTPLLSVNITCLNDTICKGDSTSALIPTAIGGTIPYTYSWAPSSGLSCANCYSPNASPTTSTCYSVTVTDACGDTTSGANCVVVHNLPLVSIQHPSPDSICSTADPLTLIGQPTGGSFAGTAVSSNHFNPTLATITSFNLFTYSFDSNGCTAVAKDSIYVNDCTSVNQVIATAGNIKIYPNPNNGIFILSSSGINGHFSVEIYNILGEQVYTNLISQNLTPSINEIDISAQPQGVYFYRVLKADGSLIGEGKVVIQ